MGYRTSLTLEALKKIHEEAREAVEKDGVPSPAQRVRSQEVMSVRGRLWAESVLLRSLRPPGLLFARASDLTYFEDQVLILADRAEWELAATKEEVK